MTATTHLQVSQDILDVILGDRVGAATERAERLGGCVDAAIGTRTDGSQALRFLVQVPACGKAICTDLDALDECLADMELMAGVSTGPVQ